MKGLKSVIVQGLFEKLAKEGHLAPVVCRSGNAIHWINLYLVDTILFAITYLLDRDLSIEHYLPSLQLGPGGQSKSQTKVPCITSLRLQTVNLTSSCTEACTETWRLASITKAWHSSSKMQQQSLPHLFLYVLLLCAIHLYQIYTLGCKETLRVLLSSSGTLDALTQITDSTPVPMQSP